MISRYAHLKIAFALWGAVGLGLLTAGLFFLFNPDFPRPAQISIISVALGLGFIKGRFVLTRVGQKNIARIYTLPEKSPFYMTFNAKSWVLVLVMILLGRLIRLAGAPAFLVGGIYIAVGTALLIGSRAYLQGKT